jgi:hypothetical protein
MTAGRTRHDGKTNIFIDDFELFLENITNCRTGARMDAAAYGNTRTVRQNSYEGGSV